MKKAILTATLMCAVVSPALAAPCVYPTTARLDSGMYGTARTEADAVQFAISQGPGADDFGPDLNVGNGYVITVLRYVKPATWKHDFATTIANRTHYPTIGQIPLRQTSFIEFRKPDGAVGWMTGVDGVNLACTP